MSPLRGYTCPPWVPTKGTQNTIDHCLGKCPHPCVAPPLLAAIYEAERRNHHQGAYISASMLAGGGCRRQTYYERYNDFFEIPRRRFWPFRGTLIHRIVEDAQGAVEQYGWMQEIRMTVPLTYPDDPAPIFDADDNVVGFDDTQPLVITMGGTCDMYNPYQRLLMDCKSMADAKADMFIRQTKGLDEYWIQQLNIYRWLISKTELTKEHKKEFKRLGLPALKGKFFPAPEELVIQAVGMMDIPRTGMPYMTKAKGWGKGVEKHTIPAIPVQPLEEIEAFVKQEAYKWYRHLILKELPEPVPKSERWKCMNCPFNAEILPGGRCLPNAAEGEPNEKEG